MRHPVKRLVYVSSVHAIPETEEKATISEAAAFSKESVIGGYASTKAEATQVVLDAVQNGLDAVVVLPSGIVGPYDRGNNHIVQLIQMYISGKLQADSGKGEGKPLFVKRKVLLAASDFENGVRTPFYPIRPALLSIPKAGKL